MIDPLLNEKHQELREQVRAFAEEEIKPVAECLDEHSTFSAELTSKMFDIGLLRIALSSEYGGMGLDTLSYIIAQELNTHIKVTSGPVLDKPSDFLLSIAKSTTCLT